MVENRSSKLVRHRAPGTAMLAPAVSLHDFGTVLRDSSRFSTIRVRNLSGIVPEVACS